MNEAYSKTLVALVVDEAHYVKKWYVSCLCECIVIAADCIIIVNFNFLIIKYLV